MKLRNHYFILRHGQTIYQTKNKEFIYPPLSENLGIKLTKKGEKQIKAAAKSMKKAGIDLIFSSDFFRTKQTAKIVAKAVDINKINFDRRLRDINLGAYHGGLKKNFYRDFPISSKKRFHKRPKKGESWLDCQKRIADFLKELERKYKGRRILIISHGEPLWLLEGLIKNWSLAKLMKERTANFINTGEFRRI